MYTVHYYSFVMEDCILHTLLNQVSGYVTIELTHNEDLLYIRVHKVMFPLIYNSIQLGRRYGKEISYNY